jgi:hypothetical protein
MKTPPIINFSIDFNSAISQMKLNTILVRINVNGLFEKQDNESAYLVADA